MYGRQKILQKKFLNLDINHSNISDIFECCVDFDFYTQQLRARLYALADKKDN